MRWDQGHESPDVIDRRGQGGRSGGLGWIFALLPFLLRSPLGWVVLVVLIGVTLFGGVIRRFLGDAGVETSGAPSQTQRAGAADPEKTQVAFVSFVLDDAQHTWTEIFAAH